MGMYFIFTTNNRNAAESVARVIDNTPVKIEKNDPADTIYIIGRAFSYRCDKAIRELQSGNLHDMVYSGAVLTGEGHLYSFNPKNGPGSRHVSTSDGSIPTPEEAFAYLKKRKYDLKSVSVTAPQGL